MRQVVRHIKIEPAVKTETKRIAISVVAMSVVMEIVFLALGRFDSTVLFGNLLGGGWAILNFFIMGLQNSYTKRLLAMVAILLIGFKVEYFNWVAVVIPMFFPRITIGLMKLPIFHRKEEE